MPVSLKNGDTLHVRLRAKNGYVISDSNSKDDQSTGFVTYSSEVIFPQITTLTRELTIPHGFKIFDTNYHTDFEGHTINPIVTMPSLAFGGSEGSGTVVINAGTEKPVDGPIQGLVDEFSLTVASGPAAQIAVDSITPNQLALRGTGENEVGTFVFNVTDAGGGPVQDGQVVTFTLDAPTGGAEFVSDSSVTTIDGQVSVSIVSGTVAGVATVTASTVSDVGTIATEARITMGNSQPDQLHLGFAADRLNIPGLIYNNLEGTITATVGDRYSNPVPAGTPVYFASECGLVALTDSDGVAINMTNQFGQATATTITGEPRDGLCRYIYWTEGEEAYIDSNGNGMYDVGEPHSDQGEPYIDANDNGFYDSNETYFDLDGNGTYTDADSVWQGDTFVWTSMNIRWSANVATPQISANDFRLYYGEPLEIEFSATDTNGNPLPSGTTISVSSVLPSVKSFVTSCF